MKYIDSHAHYLSGRFNNDRERLLERLFSTDLDYIIECGTNIKSNKNVVNLCKKYNQLRGVIGFYPLDVKELEDESILIDFKKQLSEECVVGIGEIGLDYHYDTSFKDLQKKYFRLQLKLAKELNLPVCIHSRDAEKDTLEILKEFGVNKGVIHCYAYGPKTMRELLKLGYYFGVNGTVTYTNNKLLREAVKEMPLDRILLETDCPYLSPSEYRRSRNDSSNIKSVIEELSILKGVSYTTVIEQTNKNVFEVYRKMKI